MHNTQVTSLKAYFEKVLPTLSQRHKEVLEELVKHQDASNMEIAERLRWSINRVTPRIKELRDRKLVIFSQTRRCKETREIVNAWKINEFYDVETSNLKPEIIEIIKQRTIQKPLI